MISQILGGVMLAYLVAGLLFLAALLWSSSRLKGFAMGLLGGALAAQTLAFFARWLASYNQAMIATPPVGWADKLQLIIHQYGESFLGVVGGLLASLVLAYASLGTDSSIKPLMPALKSNWLLIHVITCFLGYAAFGLAFGAGLLFLMQAYTDHPKSPAPPLLDRLMYRAAVIGFIFLTLGILTGAVWAETAWGRYWSWDPKETSSLITWFIYAALLHARLVKGWQGRPIAWLAVVGFGAVLFTYLGVSFLLPGLHSYLN
jgi:cytochrome c-type biogenesis protein CcsB